MITAPILKTLDQSKRILIAGAGGGYDIFGGIPLFFELNELGKEVHLANYSFTNLKKLPFAEPEESAPSLFQVFEDSSAEERYCPEAWLARWLRVETGKKLPIWCFEQTGVKPLQQAYKYLIDHLKLDTIILIDGGIDSILRGDESSIGTPAEDMTSLYTVQSVDVPTKLISCVGFGAELRDGICHEQALDRIAELTRVGAFLGTSSLVNQTDIGQKYRSAVEYVFEKQSEVRRSHIHSVIIEAMDGNYGQIADNVWISPLLTMYWFFSLPEVADTHLFLAEIGWTEGLLEVVRYLEGLRTEVNVRGKSRIPI